MANTSLAVLESALRARKLDGTLTTALPPLERADVSAFAPTAVAVLDDVLRGGLPRGQVSEVVGERSSGRTTVLLSLLASATGRGEIAALVDTCDRLDVASAAAAQIDLGRLLWIRGQAVSTPRGPGPSTLERVLDRAVKALNLVLQAGGFGVVAIDLADVPPLALTRLPFTTWLRVQRTIEGSDTACVLVASQPVARSAGGVTVRTDTPRARWVGASDRSRRLEGLDITARVISPRRRVDGDVRFAAQATHY